MSTNGTLLGNIIAAAMFFGIYFLPTIIAAVRRPLSLAWIAPLNTLLGWTGLGWVFALAWSMANKKKEQPLIW